MITIALINEKGGVGKTTNSLTLASGLAIRGARVLLIDSDPQANLTDHLFTPQKDALFRVLAHDAEWVEHAVSINPDVWAGEAYKAAGVGSLMLLPSHVNNRLIPLAVDDTDLMGERLDELRSAVDAVIIDTSPSSSMLHAMIYRACSHFLIPTQYEKWSLDGLARTMGRISDESDDRQKYGIPPLHVLGIQPNMTEDTIAHNHVRDFIASEYAGDVWQPIPKRTIWREPALTPDTRTIFAYAPGNIAEEEAWALIDRVMQYA